MTRILLVIPTLDRSGAEKQFTLLATGLDRSEFDVEVVALTRGGPYADDIRQAGIPLTVIGKRGKFDPFALWRLRKLILERQPDIVHSWLFAANSYVRLATGSKPGPAVIVSERCVDVWKARWQLWLDRKLIQRTTRLIGNSQPVADFYQQLGYPTDRITVIPNGIDPAPPTAACEFPSREAFCSAFNIPAEAKIIAYVGRLAAQKRLTDLLWATVLLQSFDHPVCFVIVGDGPDRGMLEQWSRSVQCDSVTRFIGHRDDARLLLPFFDAFWLASDFEGQSNSLMEAMAAGLPVIVSDIAPNRELVTDGQTGLVVPVGDRPAFTKAALKLFEDPALARQLGDHARQHMLDRFTIDRMIAAHAELYRHVAAGGCSRGEAEAAKGLAVAIRE